MKNRLFSFLKKSGLFGFYMVLCCANIVQYINIENVAVQSYAYDISMINDEDKKVVSLYFDKWIRRQTTLNIT